jgi:ribokinase
MGLITKTKDVVGLSSLNVDYIYEVEDLSFLKPFYPQDEETRGWVLTDPKDIKELEILLQKKARLISRSGGGSGANTVFCMAKMGFPSGLVGKIGRDEDGEFLLQELSSISFQHIARDQRSGKAFVVLGPSRDRIILRVPNANATLTWADLDLDFIKGFTFLHMTSLPGEGLALQERLAAEMAPFVRISFDPGEVYARRGLPALNPILRRIEVLFMTEKELGLLTGLPLKESIPLVQSLGTKIVAVKRIGAGASVFQGTESWDLPAEIIRPKDMTGAGDVFAAGFLAGLLQGQPLPICGRLGLALAHQSMLGVGREAYPGREDFERVIKKRRPELITGFS